MGTNEHNCTAMRNVVEGYAYGNIGSSANEAGFVGSRICIQGLMNLDSYFEAMM